MKNKLSSVVVIMLTLCSMLHTQKTYASHAAGGEIIYEWISDSTYRIYFKFYRDCTGVNENRTENLCVTNSCGITGPGTGTFAMEKWTGEMPGGTTNGDAVSPGCSAYKTSCDQTGPPPIGKPIPGYREWWYYHLWTSDGKCNSWNFSVSIGARNPSLNIVPTTNGNLYVETVFDNFHFEENSSPYFSVKPVPYVCINQSFTFNNGAIDPDGDSIVSEMVRPLDGNCGTPTVMGWRTPATPPYSVPFNPLQTNNTFSLDANTGQMIFTAGEIGASTITLKVTEYYTNPRKPVFNNPKFRSKIGSIMRDVQVQVMDCDTKPPNFTIPETSIKGGGWLNNRVNGCIGERLIFDFWFKSVDTDAILTIEDNHRFSIPAAKVTYSNVNSDSVYGRFEWTPGVGDHGVKGFIVTIKDSTCKPPGIMLYYPTSIPLYIWPPVEASNDTAVCPGETAFLNATGGENYKWSVLPGGGNISQLSCTACPSPVSTTTEKTTFVVTSTANSFCPKNTDTVVVDLLPGLVFTPLLDTVTCADNSVDLNLKINPPTGVNYITRWNTKLYLNDSTKPNVVATPKSTITYTVILTSTANKCRAFDTVTVGVLDGFKLENIDTAICEGASVDVRAAADKRYDIEWKNGKGLNGVISDPMIATPTITPLQEGKDIYTMWLRKKGCRDTSIAFTIDKQPIPIVKVDDDVSTCAGDTVQLNGIVTPAGYPFDLTWTPGSALTNPKIANPIFNARLSTTLVLIAKTKEAGCSATDTIKITVFPSSFLKASNDTAICPGEAAQLHVEGRGVKSFRWTPDIRISNSFSYDPIVSPSATQEYKVYAVDTNFCSDTQNVVVTVHPKALLFLPDSIRLYPGQSYRVEAGGNCSYYNWFPPIGLSETKASNPIVKPEVNTRYFVTGITETGCATQDSMNVLVSAESMIDIPNAFTPGSGENSIIKVMHLGDAILKKFAIYNRWGMLVFETTDISKGWDGNYKNEPQPIGVYVYTVEAVTPTGRTFTKQGNITLIR